jgi:hypothetical protein
LPDPEALLEVPTMRPLWPPKKQAPRKVYVGSHEDKLSRLRPMRVDPDDDQPTREDREQEKAERGPHHGTMGGGGFLA